jgi:hypothetical protein
MKTILILEDNEDRISAFQRSIALLRDGFELKVWRDAPSMCAECEADFPSAALISLDHDLNGRRAVSGRLHARLSSADSLVEHGSRLLHAQ